MTQVRNTQWGSGTITTLRPEQNGRYCEADIFKYTFLNVFVVCVLIRIPPNFDLYVQLRTCLHVLIKRFNVELATNHFQNKWWPRSITPYSVTSNPLSVSYCTQLSKPSRSSCHLPSSSPHTSTWQRSRSFPAPSQSISGTNRIIGSGITSVMGCQSK